MPPYKNTECSQIPTCKEHCYVAISDPFNTYMGPILEQISEIRTSYLPPSNSLTIGTAECCELEKWCLRLFSLSCFFSIKAPSSQARTSEQEIYFLYSSLLPYTSPPSLQYCFLPKTINSLMFFIPKRNKKQKDIS